MAKSFLDYYKEILQKVSFDHQLFNKEYKKAIKVLNEHEVSSFEKWLNEQGYKTTLSYAKPTRKSQPFRTTNN